MLPLFFPHKKAGITQPYPKIIAKTPSYLFTRKASKELKTGLNELSIGLT
jgi:hypothetical protein